MKLNEELLNALERQVMTQRDLAKDIGRSNSLVNGYVKGNENIPDEMAPIISDSIEDSELSQIFANYFFNQIPPMQSSVYKDCVYSMHIIQRTEADERKRYKEETLKVLAKHKKEWNEMEVNTITEYANNFLDEIFVELKLVTQLYDLLDQSLMKAINKRKLHWQAKKYIERR